MFPSVRKRACQWGTSNCTMLVYCRGTFKNLINCKEHWCPFINLTLPRLAILDFSFHVLPPHCSPQKQALEKPGSLPPSNLLSRRPYGPLIPLESLKYCFQPQGILNIHRGEWLHCTPGSWQLRLAERASQLQAEKTVLILCAGLTSCPASSLLETTHCACVEGALPRRMGFSEAGHRS